MQVRTDLLKVEHFLSQRSKSFLIGISQVHKHSDNLFRLPVLLIGYSRILIVVTSYRSFNVYNFIACYELLLK